MKLKRKHLKELESLTDSVHIYASHNLTTDDSPEARQIMGLVWRLFGTLDKIKARNGGAT